MRRKKAFYMVSAAVLLAVILAGCVQSQPRTLIDTNTLCVIREGRTTTVVDRVSDDTHVFIRKRVRRSDAPTEPRRAVTTATMLIDTLPGGGLSITDLTAGEVYRITLKRG